MTSLPSTGESGIGGEALPRHRSPIAVSRARKSSFAWPWLFLAPALLDVVVFRWWPLVVSLVHSVDQYTLISQTRRYIGLGNYEKMLATPAFFKSLTVTALYGLMRVPTEVLLAFVLALFVNQRILGMTVVRAAIFVPAGTSLAVMSVVWNLMYQPQYGIVNSMLNALGLPAQNFLVDAHQALAAVVVAVVWKSIGLPMIIFLAGLQGIPYEFYEAAAIDGASRLQQLRTITIPLLRRTFVYVVVVMTVFSFLDFAPIYVMTQGGPQHATYTLIFYIYEAAFVNQSLGYANALTVVLLLILGSLTLLQMRALRTDFEY